ncbi:MAG: DUF89 family protein [Firmicutes bacterium]|nr:DUF89 family protein [Bacillota bacterium]
MEQECKACLFRKYIDQYPEEVSPQLIRQYKDAVSRMLETCAEELTAPEVSHQLRNLGEDLFQIKAKDYTEIKKHFNELLLAREEALLEKCEAAPDPVFQAARYALTGNFIDFSALENVEESKLNELLDQAHTITFNEIVYQHFLDEIRKAASLAYITDNCGEIVLDKLLIRALKKQNPSLDITVIVRGAPVANDATMEDADQVGMDALARVITNGTALDGTVLRKMPAYPRSVLEQADVLIAKGQANYETLMGCGLNIFYLFMCKCNLFTKRFGVPRFSGILAAEKTGSEV